MKKHLLFTIGSVVLTIPIYSWLLYKANSGLELTQSDVWTSLLVPLFVMGWMSSKKKGYSAYDLFLLTSAICTALEIHLSAHPSISPHYNNDRNVNSASAIYLDNKKAGVILLLYLIIWYQIYVIDLKCLIIHDEFQFEIAGIILIFMLVRLRDRSNSIRLAKLIL